MANSLPAMDPVALKTRFKDRCRATENVYQNWQIRVHRSISWLAKGLEFPPDELEARSLFLWIALNSLYSRWDPALNAPAADSHARRDFLNQLCELDATLTGSLCHQHRPLIKRILGDPYLSGSFWRNPDNPKAKGRATEDVNHLDQHFRRKDYQTVLLQTMDRLFILRGQIVHGASTRGSRYNRHALRNAVLFLEQLIPYIIHITVEHSCYDDWPMLCYPPEP